MKACVQRRSRVVAWKNILTYCYLVQKETKRYVHVDFNDRRNYDLTYTT